MDLIHLDLDVTHGDLEAGALRILKHIRPQWSPSLVKFKIFTDGITNKLIGCTVSGDSDMVLVRVYGHNTDLLIDRKAETNNFKVLHKAGYAPRLYATFNNGIAYEFVPGKILSSTLVRHPDVYPIVASMMAKIHLIGYGLETPKKPILWEKIHHYLNLIPKEFPSDKLQNRYLKLFPGGTTKLRQEVDELESYLNGSGGPVVFCHNDLLLANIILQPGKVTFIDYEYAGYNYRAFDIGNHFAEFAGVSDVDYSRYPDKDFQITWLRMYLEEFKKGIKDPTPIEDQELELLYLQVNNFALASHLLWGIWALVQAHFSTIDFDFMGYAITRIQEYYSKKLVLLSLGYGR